MAWPSAHGLPVDRLPAGEDEPAAVLHLPADVGKGGDGLVEEHHPELADGGRKGGSGQRVGLGVRQDEFGIGHTALPCPLAGQPYEAL